MGTISNLAGGVPVIDFDKNSNISILLQQKGGSITGNVKLASAGGNVLEMTGGTIDGEVSATSRASSILNLNGGSITKAINLGNKGDTVNLGGTTFQALKGGTGADILNVNENYVLNGTIAAIPTINVAENKTFAVNKTIDDINALLSIASKSKVELNANITGIGKIENKGELRVNNQTLKIGDINNQSLLTVTEKGLIQTNTFTQTTPGAVFSVALFSDGTGGKVELLGPAGMVANFAANTTISPYFPSGVPTTSPTFYDILVANNGSKIVDNATLVQPDNMSPDLVLKKSLVEDDRILRISFEDMSKVKELIISTKDTTYNHQTSHTGNITLTNTGSTTGLIRIDTPDVKIDNAGKIQPDLTKHNYAIDVASVNATVNNQSTGLIQGGKSFGSAIAVVQPGFTLTNAGTISTTKGVAGVEIQAPFNSIINSGVIEATGMGSEQKTTTALWVEGAGTITNTKAGVIKSNADDTWTGANNAVNLTGNQLIMNNEGSIISTGKAGKGVSLREGAVLNNTGSIESNTDGVLFYGDLAVFDNSGVLKVDTKEASAITISAKNADPVKGTVINTGTISNLAGGNPVIDFDKASKISILLQQKGGTITGDMKLASAGGNVLEMTGGTIDGEVSATSQAASTLNLNGGSITKAINLGSKGDTVNLGGTTFQALKGGAGPNVLNVNENYVLNGTIAGIPTINIAENKTFTVNKTIDDINALLSIASKSKVEVNANITGTGKIENKGELRVNNNQIVKMGDINNQSLLTMAEKRSIQANTFTQTTAGAVFSLALLPDGTGARIELLGTGEVANLGADTTISPYFPAGLPTSFPTFYDIVVANNGSKIVDNATLVQPAEMLPGLALRKTLVEEDHILRLMVEDKREKPSTSDTSSDASSAGSGKPGSTGGESSASKGEGQGTSASGDTTDGGGTGTDQGTSSADSGSGYAGGGSTGDGTVGIVDPGTSGGASSAGGSTLSGDSSVSTGGGSSGSDSTDAAGSGASSGGGGAGAGLAPAFAPAPPIPTLPGGSSTNPELAYVLDKINNASTHEEKGALLKAISPTSHHAATSATHSSTNTIFKTISQQNLVRTRNMQLGLQDQSQGMNAGDGSRCFLGSWGEVYGATLKQKDISSTPGYHANVAGFAVGSDFGNDETARIGLAGSYTWMNVRSQYDLNMLGVNSYQVTGYGWFKPLHSPIFTEVILGLANNRYHNTRQIHIDDNLNTAAAAHYHGHYYGGEVDVGYSLVKADYYLAPLIRVKANHLNLSDYTETGAQGLNLSVNSQRLDQFSAGGGLRVARKMQSIMPEASFIVMHDFVDSNQEVLSSFIGGGEAFPTGGVQPSKTLYQTSLGVSTVNTQNYKITARYEYDFRSGFQSHAGFLQFHYFWD